MTMTMSKTRRIRAGSTCRRCLTAAVLAIIMMLTVRSSGALTAPSHMRHTSRSKPASLHRLHSTASTKSSSSSPSKAPPRSGFAQTLLNWALDSPVWRYVLVPQARRTMVQTAEANNIPWTSAKQWIQKQMTDVTTNVGTNDEDDEITIALSNIPEYYRQAFHAYDDGNLSWEAAYEVEIASCAVGARNFPQYGSDGESAFRGAFDSALVEAGAIVPIEGTVVDLGCGTGMSTRRLATNHPQAKSIIGVDLSPFFIAVGRRLLALAPVASFQDDDNDLKGPWVSNIQPDDRIQYVIGDAAKVSTSSTPTLRRLKGTVDVVNLQFVLHELPQDVTRQIIDDAFELLKPNGQLWICEMDFEAPAYAAQRANPLLFSMIRSTEPYLDEYAESISGLFDFLQTKSSRVNVIPATGRHFALVATKPGNNDDANNIHCVMNDLRFDEDGNYRVDDTHLATFWQSKQ